MAKSAGEGKPACDILRSFPDAWYQGLPGSINACGPGDITTGPQAYEKKFVSALAENTKEETKRRKL
jgi:hypothetical protein